MVVDQIAQRLRNNFLQGGTDFEEFLYLLFCSCNCLWGFPHGQMPRIKIYVRLRDVSNIESATRHLREISVDENHVILSYKLVKMDMVKFK